MNRILNWALQHGVLLIVLAFVLVGYVYREEIFHLDTTPAPTLQGIEEDASAETPVSPTFPEEPLEIEKSSTQTDVVKQQNAGDDGEEKTDTAPAASESVVPESSMSGPSDTALAAVPPSLSEGNAEPSVENKASLTAEDQEPSKTEESAGVEYRPLSEESQTKTEPQLSSMRDAYLENARQAYWSGEEEKAIAIYQTLIESYPEDADLRGELGNIFFKRGNLDMAYEYYVQTVQLLAQSGQQDRVKTFIGMVSQSDADMAKRLQAHVDTTLNR